MRLSGWVVAIAGVVVLVGWRLDLDALTRVIPGAVTMKMSTATAFVLAGVAYGLMGLRRHGGVIDFLASTAIVSLVAVMASLLYAAMTGQNSVFEHGESDPAYSVSPGVPSVCTMLAFLVAAAGGMAWMCRLYRLTEWAGRVILGMGLVALSGYLIGVPPLYCYFDGHSTAMALHTAALFVLLGLSASWRAAARDA